MATTVPTADSTALPGIHVRLKRRRLLPKEHLIDGGYTSVALSDTAARTHRIRVVGPLPPSPAWRRQIRGFTREDFTIDFDRRTVTCPKGKISGNWLELPAMAPYTVVRFNPAHCNPCPVRTSFTSGKAPRTVNFLPRHLHNLQAQNRADQQDPTWRRLYAFRSGVEGTENELVNGHQPTSSTS